MSDVLRVRGLTVHPRHGRPLLRGIELSIEPGEQVLLAGASGSGKSTLLRLIAGLTPGPHVRIEGSIEVSGDDVLGRPVTAPPLPIGWLPQDPAAAVCLPRVADDVAFGCESRCWGVGEIEAAVLRSLLLVDAADWHDRDTVTLSAGQAQRVGLAGATAPAPALLLLDEPTSMLDPEALRRVRAAVAAVAETPAPPALLLVEHRLDEWADGAGLPGRVVLLEEGGIIADGPAEQVWRDHGARLIAAGCHVPWPVERRHRPAPPTAPTAPPAAEPVLATRALAVGHDRTPIVTGATVAVHAGEVVALIGRNGAGKTTLLQTLAGIRPPLAGRIELPSGRPALIFQSPEQQFLASTVRDELAFDGAPDDQVQTSLAELRLTGAAGLSVHRLSGGEQRRLSVGTVLLGRRQAVLADEPTFGLDRDGVEWTARAFRDAAARGRGVLLTSHDLRFVLAVADRTDLIHQGEVLAGGPTAAVLADPLLARAGLPLPAAVREALGVAA